MRQQASSFITRTDSGIFFVCLTWLCRVFSMVCWLPRYLSLQALSSVVPDGCVCSSLTLAKCHLKKKKVQLWKPTSNQAFELKGVKWQTEIFILSGSKMLNVRGVEVNHLRLYEIKVCVSPFFCWWQGVNVNCEAEYHKYVVSSNLWKVPMLEIPQLCACGTDHPFKVIQAGLISCGLVSV